MNDFFNNLGVNANITSLDAKQDYIDLDNVLNSHISSAAPIESETVTIVQPNNSANYSNNFEEYFRDYLNSLDDKGLPNELDLEQVSPPISATNNVDIEFEHENPNEFLDKTYYNINWGKNENAFMESTPYAESSHNINDFEALYDLVPKYNNYNEYLENNDVISHKILSNNDIYSNSSISPNNINKDLYNNEFPTVYYNETLDNEYLENLDQEYYDYNHRNMNY